MRVRVSDETAVASREPKMQIEERAGDRPWVQDDVDIIPESASLLATGSDSVESGESLCGTKLADFGICFAFRKQSEIRLSTPARERALRRAHPITPWRNYDFETVRDRERKRKTETEMKRKGKGKDEEGNRENGSGRISPVHGMKKLSQPVELCCVIAQPSGRSPVHDEHRDFRRGNTGGWVLATANYAPSGKSRLLARPVSTASRSVLIRVYLACYISKLYILNVYK